MSRKTDYTNDYKDDLGRSPLDDPNEGLKTLLNQRSTIFHLPHKLCDPESEYEYGLEAYMCGGQDAESFHSCEERGWNVVHESELPEGVRLYSGNEVAYGRGVGDGYYRKGGQILVRRKRWVKKQIEQDHAKKLKEYSDKVEKFHVWDKSEMDGPYHRDRLMGMMRHR